PQRDRIGQRARSPRRRADGASRAPRANYHAREQGGDPAASACGLAAGRRSRARLLRERGFSDRDKGVCGQARAAMDRPRIDSHHYCWWTGRHAYAWPAAAGDRLARDFTPDDLRAEIARCGIDGTVLVQVLPQADGETAEFLDISREVDFVRGVVGWLPLVNP